MGFLLPTTVVLLAVDPSLVYYGVARDATALGTIIWSTHPT
jgi:hypothetical protein